MQGRDTSVQTWVEQTAQQSGVSLPQSGTSPCDRREEGLPPSWLLQSQGDALAELREQFVRQLAAGDPSAAEVRDGGGSSHFGSGFGQTVAAYRETAKSTSGKDRCTTKTPDSTARN